jgi:alkanesulfonate monooxygenase SsuD/methylene tetrahydromethanopterin reductase-like flavin-dependent oxidoreductase (luciferase family)
MPDNPTSPFIVGVALDGAGWHPAAWREPTSRPDDLFNPGYWTDLVTTAEQGLLDFATIEDSFALQSSQRLVPDERTDEVRGRLDARLVASRVAPATTSIGLIPTVVTSLTEPFHVSKAIATLDFASLGRAGVQPRVAARSEEYSHLGADDPLGDRAGVSGGDELATALTTVFDNAADEVEVIRELWDSWEDDAEIRDAATDRFIDADKLHTVDFDNGDFSVRGPSITPRPPQGQPVVAALAHADIPYRFAARAADLVFVTPDSPLGTGDAAEVLAAVRAAEQEVGRHGEPLKVIADLVVLLDETAGADGPTGESAADRLARLDGLSGDGRALSDDTEARIVVGSADDIAGVIAEFADAGYDGVRLRPAVLTDDLPRIATDLAPRLRQRGLARDSYPENTTLRGLVGLPTDVPSRYAGQSGHISPAPTTAL